MGHQVVYLPNGVECESHKFDSCLHASSYLRDGRGFEFVHHVEERGGWDYYKNAGTLRASMHFEPGTRWEVLIWDSAQHSERADAPPSLPVPRTPFPALASLALDGVAIGLRKEVLVEFVRGPARDSIMLLVHEGTDFIVPRTGVAAIQFFERSDSAEPFFTVTTGANGRALGVVKQFERITLHKDFRL